MFWTSRPIENPLAIKKNPRLDIPHNRKMRKSSFTWSNRTTCPLETETRCSLKWKTKKKKMIKWNHPTTRKRVKTSRTKQETRKWLRMTRTST